MTDLEFRRRIIAAWGLDNDKFADFDLGCVSLANMSITDAVPNKVAMSPFIPTDGGHSYTVDGGWRKSGSSINNIALALYDNNKNCIDYYGLRTDGSRTITLNSSFSFMRLTIDMDNLASAYILDNTTGQYVFQGSDYI